MSRIAPAPWIRRVDGGAAVELWFPYDVELIGALKALIPWHHRDWLTGPAGRAWRISGEPYCTQAEEWFGTNVGRGREIARGQLEMAL